MCLTGSGCRGKNYTCNPAETHIGPGATVEGLCLSFHMNFIPLRPKAADVKGGNA